MWNDKPTMESGTMEHAEVYKEAKPFYASKPWRVRITTTTSGNPSVYPNYFRTRKAADFVAGTLAGAISRGECKFR